MKNEKYIYWGLGVLGLVVVAMYFTSQKGTSTEPSVKYQQLDRLRKDAIVKSRMQRDKTHVENYQKAPELSEKYREISNGEQDDGGLRLEASVSAATKDIAEGELHSLAINSLENKINQKLLNDQQAAQMNIVQKKRFAEEYTKRALAMGYAVVLNDKLEIIKVQKVENSKQPKMSAPVDVDSIEEEEEFE